MVHVEGAQTFKSLLVYIWWADGCAFFLLSQFVGVCFGPSVLAGEAERTTARVLAQHAVVSFGAEMLFLCFNTPLLQ